MGLPTNGYRHLVAISDKDGNTVGLVFDGTTYRLAVDALVAGPIVIGGVELDDGGGGTTRASIKGNGIAVGAAPNDGGLLVSGRDPGGLQRHLAVDTSGRLLVNASDATPGATVGPTPADTAVGVGATVALPALPAGLRRFTVQNVGPATSLIRVREVGAGAGRGAILARFASMTFGGTDGAIAALEVQEVAGIATAVTVIYEGD